MDGVQQPARRQGSPWKSPGPKLTSPRVSRLPGFEPRLLEPEELAWDAQPSSSSRHQGDDSSSEAQAAPKEADHSAGAQPEDGSLSVGSSNIKSGNRMEIDASRRRRVSPGGGAPQGVTAWGGALSARKPKVCHAAASPGTLWINCLAHRVLAKCNVSHHGNVSCLLQTHSMYYVIVAYLVCYTLIRRNTSL